MARQVRAERARSRQRRGGGDDGDDQPPADTRPEHDQRTKQIIDRLSGRGGN